MDLLEVCYRGDSLAKLLGGACLSGNHGRWELGEVSMPQPRPPGTHLALSCLWGPSLPGSPRS